MKIYEVVAQNGSRYHIQKVNSSWCLRKVGEEEWMLIGSWGQRPGQRLDSILDIGRIRLRNELFGRKIKATGKNYRRQTKDIVEMYQIMDRAKKVIFTANPKTELRREIVFRIQLNYEGDFPQQVFFEKVINVDEIEWFVTGPDAPEEHIFWLEALGSRNSLDLDELADANDSDLMKLQGKVISGRSLTSVRTIQMRFIAHLWKQSGLWPTKSWKQIF
jgi:hypothetical protein